MSNFEVKVAEARRCACGQPCSACLQVVSNEAREVALDAGDLTIVGYMRAVEAARTGVLAFEHFCPEHRTFFVMSRVETEARIAAARSSAQPLHRHAPSCPASGTFH